MSAAQPSLRNLAPLVRFGSIASFQACDSHFCFSNRPFRVKRFQTNHHHYSVDVAHGLVLLFGIGTRPLYGAFLVKKFLCRAAHHFPSSVSLFDPKVRSFVPMVKPHRDVFEHDGAAWAVGMTIRGEPAFGRGSIAPQPCIR
jgi:hypothetical protein